MQPKRKNTNKQNKKQPKRVPLGNLLSLPTEDIRLTAYQSAQLKAATKTVDLRKPSSGNPYKKTVSRKSNSKSVKQHPLYQPPKLKSLMKQFKELKLMHENERSKSRSPVSCKSRSIEKYLPKKLSFKTFSNSRHSSPNLTQKLEKTIKKLNETNFFREEDSLIPLSSSSGTMSERKGEVLLTEHDEIVDMGEVRQFCSTATIAFKKSEAMAFKTYDLFKETMAALKIQRAWRNCQTRRLIGRYAFLYQHDQVHHYLHRHDGPTTPLIESGREEAMAVLPSELLLLSEDCYGSGGEGEAVRRVSALQSSEGGDYEQMVTKMKMQELQKWNQIINIISASRNEQPKSLEQLLQKLAEQSEMNKRELEDKARSIIRHSPQTEPQNNGSREREKRQTNIDKEIARVQHRRDQSSSSQSVGMEEYDSKKYIDYLDGDIFVETHQQQQHSLISKYQQQTLLDALDQAHPPARLGDSSLYRSESFTALLREEEGRASSRQLLKRSTSEKTLKRMLHQMSGEGHEEEINLDLLTKEFLEGTDPLSDNFDMVYSEEKLRSKLAELNRVKNEHEDSWDYQDQPCPESPNVQLQGVKIVPQEGQHSEQDQLEVRPKAGWEIRIEENEESPIKVEVVEGEIASSSSDAVSEEGEKSETVAAILMNNLVVEVLKEIAGSDTLSTAFKTYSLSLRPKVRKSDGRKKKGFPTTKAEIEHFVEGLIKYLEKEQPDVYRNLEVPTGPTAEEMLRYMHQTGEDSWDSESDEEDSNVMVIPNRVFDAFWGIKQRSIVIEVPQGYDQSNSLVFKHQFQLLKSFNKIFYRSLFDTFNECLDLERNYGQYGRPFPWKMSAVFDHHKSQEQLKKGVQRAKGRMLELSTTYCGLIVEKEEMASISEQYIQQVHEDRLSRMLAGDLLEAEERWVFYDDEETQILVEVTNAIYTELLIELIETLYGTI